MWHLDSCYKQGHRKHLFDDSMIIQTNNKCNNKMKEEAIFLSFLSQDCQE